MQVEKKERQKENAHIKHIFNPYKKEKKNMTVGMMRYLYVTYLQIVMGVDMDFC